MSAAVPTLRAAAGAGLLLAAAALATAPAARADEATRLAPAIGTGAAAGPAQTGARLPVWRVDGRRNTVYLLGSVHMLRDEDYPLPAGIDAVYEESERLVMEIDLDEVDALASGALLFELGVPADGETLESLLGAGDYARAAELAGAIDLDMALFRRAEPWFAALTATQVVMMREGYDPNNGVEIHFLRRAREDGKTIDGLETLEQQLRFFDELPPEVQEAMLLQTLSDLEETGQRVPAIVSAWRSGDTERLERELLDGFDGFPELREVLVERRNRAWLEPIEALLGEDEDYLVIVGALHLVGEDGLPALLEARGREVRQLAAH